MSEPQLSPVTTIPDTELVPETGKPLNAHIVRVEPGQNAAAAVLEARINGTPVEALCGYVWVPSRNPQHLPLCEECKSIYELERMLNEHLNERPAE